MTRVPAIFFTLRDIEQCGQPSTRARLTTRAPPYIAPLTKRNDHRASGLHSAISRSFDGIIFFPPTSPLRPHRHSSVPLSAVRPPPSATFSLEPDPRHRLRIRAAPRQPPPGTTTFSNFVDDHHAARMTRAPSPPALGELRSPSSPAAQVSALKQLKNFIVGHDQRKELVVRRGIIPELARVLQANVKAAGKRRQRHLNGGGGGASTSAPAAEGAESWTQEDEERLQATLIVGSLAVGGPPFVAPILAGDLLQPLLAALSPSDAPPKLVIATLRTLISLASATGSVLFPNTYRERIAHEIYQKPDGDSLTEILAQRSAMRTVQEQIGLTAELISKTCRKDDHRNFLVKSGALDLLSSHFAAHVSASSLVSPVVEVSAIASFPPAPSKSNFLHIVSAISSIIAESSYRTARFLYSQPVVAIFPTAKQISAFEKYGFMIQPRSSDFYNTQNIAPYEYILPQLQVAQTKESSFSKAFPALGSLTAPGDGTRISSFADPNAHSAKHVTGQEYETAIYAWCIRMAREHLDDDRLVFVELLAELVKFAETNPIDNRSEYAKEGQRRLLAVLIVPLLAKMADEGDGGRSERSTKAMRLMAALLEYDPILQNAAADSGIIRKVCQVLKKSFDVVVGEQSKAWSPIPSSPDEMDSLDGIERADVLGSPGIPQEVHILLKSRECSLLALAAIAHKEDPHRKTIIESGAVACIADSLIPYKREDEEMARGPILTGAKDGNPVPVLIAACNAARAMSRSVSVLRTSMMDYGIAKPIYGLLKHPVIDVQIATTDVLCNLLLQFSPMREDLIEAGVVKTLCEHAHSADSRIRLISLWALKHLVLQADNEIKIQCLEELGTGWLINTVSGEARQVQMPAKGHLQHSRPATPSLSMGTPNAAGEQVDLLNAVDEPSMDIDNDTGASGDEDDVMADSIGLLRNRSANSNSTAAKNRAKLRAIKDAETNPIIRAQKEDLRTQEQALDFIRNLIMTDAGSSPGDMIDHVLQTFGRDRFFEILTAKLRPRSAGTTPFSSSQHSSAYQQHTSESSSPNPPGATTTAPAPGTTRSASGGGGGGGSTSAPSDLAHLAPPEILLATAFIVVHVANGKPSHRQLVIAQAGLMRELLPLFAHPDRRIRVACVWLVNNLTWIEDASDHGAARQRALELRGLGVEERVRLCLSDAELDVRERAKTAVEQVGKLIEGLGHGGGTTSGTTGGSGGGTPGAGGSGASSSGAASGGGGAGAGSAAFMAGLGATSAAGGGGGGGGSGGHSAWSHER
ncbi:armadillo repeat protein [Diplodia corticola]|uniref:Armadillo repeat protein n=1 Tax=Diplodia corticola TaxID=236234 RepID=A0A1J9RUL9_9PEZI|nr:armadillo repeat protein [Diplodia corticola]OJD31548.1 armadillo repeat protein [Diplodia corticola]